MKKKLPEAKYHSNNKYEYMHRRDGEERYERLQTCAVLVCPILEFDINHTKTPKLKYPKVMICYDFGLEKLKGIPNKLELVDSVTEFFIKHCCGLVHR